MKHHHRIPGAVLLFIALALGQATAIACEETPGQITISVSGAQAGSDQNYYVVQIPEQGHTTVTITGSGQTPCPTDADKCTCQYNTDKLIPEKDGALKYTFSPMGAGNQDANNGPKVTWDVNSSTSPGEYKFKVTEIKQDYKACPQGWAGGVASKSNTQESEEVTVLAFKIEITGSHQAIESQDSNEFEAKVTPAAASPSAYNWLDGAPDAWPNGSGNNPQLDYSAPQANKTKVKKTRWFAPTNNRRQLVDGNICTYKVNCEVTIKGVNFKALTPAELTVFVNNSGETSIPDFSNWQSIQVSEVNGVWGVIGKGGFTRTSPQVTVNLPNTSQFYAKISAHENKHLTDLTTVAPWKDLYDADALYTSKIQCLTSTVSEADLRIKILNEITTQRNADNQVIQNTTCQLEKRAFDVENATAPDFLELDDADWKPIYGCP